MLGAIDGLGGVDVVVNNAGGNGFSSPIVGMRFSGWQKTSGSTSTRRSTCCKPSARS